MKYKHKYLCKSAVPPYITVSFTIKVGERLFGHYEEFIGEEDKFRMLRSLVYTKHNLIAALYQELEFYTDVAKSDPTEDSIYKLGELTKAMRGFRDENM